MSDSDSGSAGSAAHAPKIRKGPDGQVAKLRNRFEPPMSQALVVVPPRRSARVASASQPQRANKRCRSSAQPADSAAPAVSSAADPSADSPAGLSAVTLAGFLARIEALEQRSTDVQQLRSDLLQAQNELAAVRSDLLQTQTELATTRSDLAEFRGSIDKQLGDQTSHSIARETAVKVKLQQQLSAEGSSLEHLSQRVRANNIVLHGVRDIAAHSRPADLTRYVSNKLDAAAPHRGHSSQTLSQSIQAVSHIGRPGSGKRAVLVQFSTHTAKHEVLQRRCRGQLRRSKAAGNQRDVLFLSQLLKTNPRQFWRRASLPHIMLPPELQTPAAWDGYLSSLTAPPAHIADQLPLPHTPQPPAPATCLDQPLTEAEIEVGLRKLHNGRSGALLGYTSELLRYAKLTATEEDPAPAHLLVPCLQLLFNTAFSTGAVPQSWKTSLVTPILKKGDATDTANYRPIAVGEPLSRLYASILVQRLVQFTEQQDLRSPTQAGYRPEHSTIHQAFVLQHVIDKHRRLKSPLYLCFVDLKSAYDRVQWPLLWDLLQRLGVQGKMMGAVQSVYDNCLLSMRVSGYTGEGKTPSMGLRQGCPLSATLFGLFIDGLHHYLETVAPAVLGYRFSTCG